MHQHCGTFAASFVLCGCSLAFAAIPQLPDLRVDHIRLDSNGALFVKISNEGDAAVPAGVSHLRVFVDHWLAADIDLGDPSVNQVFRSVGGSTEIDLQIRLYGSHRRVLAIVDPENEVPNEKDELRNSMSMDFNALNRSGFDLYVVVGVQVRDSIQQAYFTLRNKGNLDSPANLQVTFRVYDEAGVLLGTRTQEIPSIPATCDPDTCDNVDCATGLCQIGDCVTTLCDYFVQPSIAIPIANLPQRIRGTIQMPTFDDLDSLNNAFEVRLDYVTRADVDPTDPGTEYGAMLADNGGAIKNAMKWPPACQGGSPPSWCPTLAASTMSFDAWPDSGDYGVCPWPGPSAPTYACPTKEKLTDFLLALEQGREIPMSDSLAETIPIGTQTVERIPQQAGVDIYLAHVAQSLWFEAHGQELHGATWSLADLDANLLAFTGLNSSSMLSLFVEAAAQYGGGPVYYAWSLSVDPAPEGSTTTITPWNPRIIYHFLNAQDIIRSSADDTAWALTGWWRAFTIHGSCAMGCDPVSEWDYAGYFPADKIYYPWAHAASHHGYYSPHGCSTSSALWTHTLRAINIPAQHDTIRLGNLEQPTGARHHRLRLPTIRKPCDGPGEPACCGQVACCDSPPCADSPGVVVSHSDDFYGSDQHSWGEAIDVPPHLIPDWQAWFSFEEGEYFLDGALTLLGGHTEAQQRGYNAERYRYQRILVAPSGEMMKYRSCESNCNMSLCGSDCTALASYMSDPQRYSVPFFDPNTEQPAIRAGLDQALSELSGSDSVAAQTWLNSVRSNAEIPAFVGPSSANQAPVVNAFARTELASPGCPISLEARATDGDVGPLPLSYYWTSSAPSAAFSSRTDPKPTVTAPGIGGDYTFTVTVSDGASMSQVTMTVTVVGAGADPNLEVRTEGPRYLAIASTGSGAVAFRVTSPAYPCLSQFAQGDGTLGPGPIFKMPAEWCTVYLGDAELVPNKPYEVRADYGGGNLSAPFMTTLWKWGDVNNSGAANFTDINLIVEVFRNLPVAGSKFRYDLAPATPSRTVNFQDISAGVDAFRNFPYTYPVPCQ